ncbi:hypothetical protein ACLOJK_011035 [Asimina triloba]
MAEVILTPNAKQKPPPMSARLQSPTSPFFLGSNDDQLERAQARAARAAANRRKSTVLPSSQPSDRSDLFDKEQIAELFQNCIKLASENKINQKNTWDLTLIDHLSEIIRVEAEDDTETNFQKASCTLEAGVKIYSLRVDSVHSEAYKVLGGINRAGQENDKDDTPQGEENSVQESARPKKELEKKISPLSTLESSFEALNVKKFDVAFAVDPLYHQTSAQMDEGGAKGLLLNNLGVYGGCRLFPEQIEQMLRIMPQKNDISPTLRDIVNQFDEENERPSAVLSVDPSTVEQDGAAGYNQAGLENDAFDYGDPGGFDHDDQTSVHDDFSTSAEPSFTMNDEEIGNHTFPEPDGDDRFEKIAGFAFLGLGFISKRNAWAGPDHWKYRKAKGPEQIPVSESGSLTTSKKSKTKKQASIDIDFSKSLGKEMPDIFAPPRKPKSLLLPANRVPCNTVLPEDCHYQPEDLVKLFLRPNTMCIGKRGRKSSEFTLSTGYTMSELRQQNHTFESFESWENDSGTSDHFDNENVLSDTEDSTTLVSQPRQVNKIEVQYDKSSKHVDVHKLKETLWDHIQESTQTTEMGHEKEVSFKYVLSSFPSDCAAAASKDISPHLCFICLLHLANEHGLSIHDNPSLDDLRIHIPEHSGLVR